MSYFEIKNVSASDIVLLNKKIPEFIQFDQKYLEERYQDKKHINIIAYVDNVPAGYIVAYDKYQDWSFYCWLAAVDPKFRRKWVFTKLMNHLFDWSEINWYQKIKIKTRNNRREMLNYLVQNWFNFIEVIVYENIIDNRILLEKDIK